jgi:putative ABC transport system permease protein
MSSLISERTVARPGYDKSVLRAVDLLPISTLGLRFRRVRAMLSALGIAIGIASIVAVLGVTRSSQSFLLSEIGKLGTNLLTVSNGQTNSGVEQTMPATAASMIRQMPDVLSVAPTAQIPETHVYRTDRIPVNQAGGLVVRAGDATLLTTLEGSVMTGRFLDQSPYPITVLGQDAAKTLGITTVGPNSRVWLGGRWFTVAGILNRFPYAPEVDRSALVSFPAAASLFGYQGHASRIYVRAKEDRVVDVSRLLGYTANPGSPQQVSVSRPSEALTAQLAVKQAGNNLFLGLSAIALLVGAIGIANIMVIAVLERRSEIGLRRALGATGLHISLQFLTEALLLSTVGGAIGLMIGSAVTAGMAVNRGWQVLIPPEALGGGMLMALLVGAVAGLYPAIRAARMSPTDALRTS